MYSMPIVRQYESRSTPRMSRSFMTGTPPNPPVANSRSRSHNVSAVIDDVEVGMLAHLELERVGVGHQVAAHAVGVDQLDDPSRLADLVVVRRDDVLHPAHRLVRDAQGAEQVVVEPVFAEQQPMNLPQELTRLRALNHPVVVGRGDAS